MKIWGLLMKSRGIHLSVSNLENEFPFIWKSRENYCREFMVKTSPLRNFRISLPKTEFILLNYFVASRKWKSLSSFNSFRESEKTTKVQIIALSTDFLPSYHTSHKFLHRYLPEKFVQMKKKVHDWNIQDYKRKQIEKYNFLINIVREFSTSSTFSLLDLSTR